jgi:hypothetical protein
MKKSFLFNSIIMLVMLFTLTSVNNVQATIINTKTGLPIVQPVNTGSIPGPVATNPLWLRAAVNNGWNGEYISSIGASGSDYYAQSFIATMTSITKFGVVIRQGSAVGEVRLAIVSDNAGTPNYASPLYMGTLKTPTSTGAWYYETGLSIAVVPGQKYYVLIDGYDIPTTTGWSWIGISSNAPIPGEGIVWSNSGGVGAWQGYSSYPLAIFVEGVPAPVPVPYWIIVLAFVVIGTGTIVAFRKKLAKQAI